jgi:hypothetical protein
MDAKEQYQELTDKLMGVLPLKAYPIRSLVNVFRDNGAPVTLKTELTITGILNSGDVSGIICVVKDDGENVLACGLTHLIFAGSCPLFKEISDYQKKREKRIQKLNKE